VVHESILPQYFQHTNLVPGLVTLALSPNRQRQLGRTRPLGLSGVVDVQKLTCQLEKEGQNLLMEHAVSHHAAAVVRQHPDQDLVHLVQSKEV